MFGGLFKHAFRKPRQFDYMPRYYDPEKDARDARRREVLGEAAYTEEEIKAMKPGEYIRENMRIRRGYNSKRVQESRARTQRRGVIFLVILILVAIWLFF